MKIINLTPHNVTVDDGDNTHVYPATGEVARVIMDETVCDKIDGFQVVTTRPLKIVGIPMRLTDTYIVSTMVLDYVKTYLNHKIDHFIAPDTGPTAKRNVSGHIVSVRRWKR